MTFKSPIWITPMPPSLSAFGGEGHMGKSQWKSGDIQSQFRVEINT
jgi:hypothetical protein